MAQLLIILELLSTKTQLLLFFWNILLVLDFGLYILNSFWWLNIECNSLVIQSLDVNLHFQFFTTCVIPFTFLHLRFGMFEHDLVSMKALIWSPILMWFFPGKIQKGKYYSFASESGYHMYSDMTIEIWEICNCSFVKSQHLIWESNFASHINFDISWLSFWINAELSSKEIHIVIVIYHPTLFSRFFFLPI